MSDREYVPFVKICGLRTSRDAIAATQAGASHLGFVLSPSRRQVNLATMASIRAKIQEWVGMNPHRRMPLLTAVVVNASNEELHAISESGTVDIVQLSGDERPEVLDEFELPAFKAIRISPELGESGARNEIETWLDRARPASGILVDAWHPESYGGTGLVADWSITNRLAIDYPIWLAGGLTPENVATAIAQVRPYGVDVSSGVERDGHKDVARIRAFLAAVRSLARA